MRRGLTILALTGAVTLTACADLPDFRPAPPRATAPATIQSSPLMDIPAGDIGIRRSASAAEAACVAQGEMQGMNVQSVVGTRENTTPAGQPTSRDVMLRVARGQQVFDVRCRYDYASSEARIMTL